MTPFDFLDDDDTPPAPDLDWNAEGETPTALRDYAKVIAHAEPIRDPVKDTYSWLPSLAPWFGLNPPAGVVPCEMMKIIVHVSGRHPSATRAGALAKLTMAMWKIEGEVR